MNETRSKRRGASRSAPQPRPADRGARLRAYGAGVASGLFMAFLIYLATLPPDTRDDAAAPPVAASEPSLPRPSFDFYELLPQSEPDPELPGRPATKPAPGSAGQRTQYVLQAGSFRDPADADRRRAELLLLGLEPAVEPTDADNGRWYRVLLGPFDSRSAMARVRSLTAQQDIDTLLMRRQAGDA